MAVVVVIIVIIIRVAMVIIVAVVIVVAAVLALGKGSEKNPEKSSCHGASYLQANDAEERKNDRLKKEERET